jgi:hypothetical protein
LQKFYSGSQTLPFSEKLHQEEAMGHLAFLKFLKPYNLSNRMTNYFTTRIACLLAVCFAALQTKASEGKPVTPLLVHSSFYVITDTVPPVQKPTNEKPAEEKPATTNLPVIKEVPKARKQIKPLALPTLPAKPVKIVRPIIKRVGSLLP